MKGRVRRESPSPDTPKTHTETYRTVFLAAALVALTANAYAPVFQCGYVWDDDSYVTKNPTLETADGLRRIWFEVGATPQYYPLVFTTFWAEYQLRGLDPAVSHTINVLLHYAAALLVWRVLLQLGATAAIAWIAAFLFAVHPVHVESVAWITERKNVLSGVFYLGALLAYLQFDARGRSADEGPRAARRWWYYALAFVLFVAALLSKTVTASLPVAIGLLIWYQYGKVKFQDVARLLPFFALAVALGSLTVWLERHHVGAVGQDWNLSLIERVLLAGRAAWFYAGKLLWPYPIIFVYPRWNIDSAIAWQYLYPAAALGLVAGVWYKRDAIGRAPLVAVLFFAVTLAPALGFVNVFPMRYSYVADHFQYLASLGVIVLIAIAAWRIYSSASPQMRPTMGLMGAVCVIVLAALTWRQVHDYVDIETLWNNTLAKNEDAWMAAHNLGVLHMERREIPQAERYFTQVVRIRPDDARAQNNLGLICLSKRDLPGAIARFEMAIRGEPDFVGARINLCQIQLLTPGQTGQAVENYLHALGVDPNVAEAQEQLALQLMRTADRVTAERLLKRALQLRPKWPLLVNELAWRLATSPSAELRDPQRALALAKQAVEMSDGRDANVLDTLAAAYAARGEFEQAVETARQASALRVNSNTPIWRARSTLASSFMNRAKPMWLSRNRGSEAGAGQNLVVIHPTSFAVVGGTGFGLARTESRWRGAACSHSASSL